MMRKEYSFILIVLYVYYLLITGRSTSSIVVVKTALHDTFSMTNMGLLNNYVGIEIV
jgi:hypothetical protein